LAAATFDTSATLNKRNDLLFLATALDDASAALLCLRYMLGPQMQLDQNARHLNKKKIQLDQNARPKKANKKKKKKKLKGQVAARPERQAKILQSPCTVTFQSENARGLTFENFSRTSARDPTTDLPLLLHVLFYLFICFLQGLHDRFAPASACPSPTKVANGRVFAAKRGGPKQWGP